jgi:hypothetical protein
MRNVVELADFRDMPVVFVLLGCIGSDEWRLRISFEKSTVEIFTLADRDCRERDVLFVDNE